MSQQEKKVVMLVDDSRTIRNLVALLLHRHGYRSLMFSSAMEALNGLRHVVPDLILLDITLPGMDGLDLCRVIKENKTTQHIPVVMLSGNDEVFDKVLGRLAGAADYITKPFQPQTILQCLETYCGQKDQAA